MIDHSAKFRKAFFSFCSIINPLLIWLTLINITLGRPETRNCLITLGLSLLIDRLIHGLSKRLI